MSQATATQEEVITSDKSRGLALLLVFTLCVGVSGIHRFYVGKVGTGILQLVTFGGFGFWAAFDAFLIISGIFRDKELRPLVKW